MGGGFDNRGLLIGFSSFSSGKGEPKSSNPMSAKQNFFTRAGVSTKLTASTDEFSSSSPFGSSF
eukprot:UN19413